LAQGTDQHTQPGGHAEGLVVAGKAGHAKADAQGTASAALLTLCKQLNECVFDGAQPSVRTLVAKIKNETALWAQAGTKGLRVVLPSTWVVH
jgi:hypothetical protein